MCTWAQIPVETRIMCQVLWHWEALACFLLLWEKTISNMEREAYISPNSLQSIMKGNKGSYSWHEPGSENQCRFYREMPLTGLLDLLSFAIWITWVGLIVLSVDWAFSYHPSIKKMPHRLIYRPIWWRQFLTRGLLFWDDPSLLSSFARKKNSTSTLIYR